MSLAQRGATDARHYSGGTVSQAVGAFFAVVIGALSALRLLELGFAAHFAPPLGVILDAYEALASGVLGALSTIVLPLVRQACAACAVTPDLEPHWKHVAVLMLLYFLGGAGSETRSGGTAALFALWGAIVALASGIAVGTIALAQGEAWASFFVATIPLAGVAAFDVGASLWNARAEGEATWLANLTLHLYYSVRRAAVGLVLIVAGLQVPAVRELASPGLAMLGVGAVALALYWLWQGAKGSPAQTRLGAAMLGVLVLAGLLVTANAAFPLMVN